MNAYVQKLEILEISGAESHSPAAGTWVSRFSQGSKKSTSLKTVGMPRAREGDGIIETGGTKICGISAYVS